MNTAGRWLVACASIGMAVAVSGSAANAGMGPIAFRRPQPVRPTTFAVTVLTGLRGSAPDPLGLSTVVEAGTEHLMFDCGVVASTRMPQLDWDAGDVTALFLTRLTPLTTGGIDALYAKYWRSRTDATPIRIWGPSGTRERIRQLQNQMEGGSGRDTAAHEVADGVATAVDIQQGVISELNGVTVMAIALAGPQPTFAYRIAYNGLSVLILSDAGFSEPLTTLARGVNVVIVRHSDGVEAGRILRSIKPRLAVLFPDGIPNAASLVRQQYAGALEIEERPIRIDIASTALIHRADDDSKARWH